MTRAALYNRISKDATGQGLGVARQEKDGRALAKARGWTVTAVYTDDDISAYSRKHRPGYEAMLDAVKHGTIDAIIAWHPDRLHRSTRELLDFIDVIETAHCAIATVQGGDYDLTTSTGRMAATVVGAVAQNESDRKSERQKRKARELAEAGRPSGGGTRPYGFDDDRLTPRPEEAARIREAAQRLCTGETLRSIRADFHAQGVATVTGKPWTLTVLRRMLTSPRNAGVREHAGITYPAVWPAILDEVTWKRCRTILFDPARRTTTGPTVRYLLTGFVHCDVCKAKLVARPKANKARCYVCATDQGGCGKIRRLADPLEDYVIDWLLERHDAGLLVEPDDGDTGAAMAVVEQLELQLAEAATDYYTHRSITKGQFAAVSASLGARLTDARAAAGRTHRAEVSRPAGGDLRAEWENEATTLDRKRALVDRYIDQVIVLPAVRGRNVFDSDKVQVIPKS